MTIDVPVPEFDQLADVFWRLGVMQSPSQLHGYLVGLLSVGASVELGEWLPVATAYIDAVEPPDEPGSAVLLALFESTRKAIGSGDMDLSLLLPDDAVEITQRIESLGQWCQGFMVGFAQGGKHIQQQEGQQQYSEDVTEALNDLAAISQITLSEDDENEEQREQNIFEISEYVRLAAITVYLECRQPTPAVKSADTTKPDEALVSPNHLFANKNKTLH